MRATVAALILAGVLAGALPGSLSVRAQAPASQWSGIYTAAQAGRGEKIYQDKCSSCHAPDATGGDAPALKGNEFAVNWDDLSVGDLFERIRVSMPQDAPGTLKPEQIVEVMAFLFKSGDYPAGQTDLAPDAAQLKTIKFRAKK